MTARCIRCLLVFLLFASHGISAADGESEITRYFYDANGNLTRIVDPLQHESQHRYDALDRLVETRDALDGRTRYTLDALDRVVGFSDPLETNTLRQFDGLGNLLRIDSPDSGVAEMEYDEAGNLVAATDARGVTLRYRYDALDRLTDIEGGAVPIRLRYDEGTNALGRLSALTDEAGDTAWEYDRHGRVTARTSRRADATLSLRYQYDDSGRLRQISYPSGHIIGIDWRNGQVSGVSRDGLPLLEQVTYEPFGPASAWVWGNGAYYRRSFDLDGRLVEFPLAQGRHDLLYDAAGRLLSLTDSDPMHDQRFAYDALHRLTQSQTPQGTDEFAYDANGNRSDNSGVTYLYVPASNRLLMRGSDAYAHDAAGNVLSDGRNRYTYDAFGRLKHLENGGASFEYQYDGFGTRAAKWLGSIPDMAGDVDRDGRFSVLDARKLALMANGELAGTNNADCDHDGAVSQSDVSCVAGKIIDQRLHPGHYNQPGTLFLHDAAGHLLGEYRRDGTPIREFVWLYDQPVAILQPDERSPLLAETYFVFADHLGTPRAVADTENRPVWRWDGRPFGNDAANEDPDGDGRRFEFNLRLPGQYFDAESGLHYNMARYYDPSTGRYLQPDPIGAPRISNLYVYVGNNPIIRTDPEGLLFWDLVDIGLFANSLRIYNQCPDINNAINLGLDTAGLLPGIPALGTIRRIGQTVDVAKGLATGKNEAVFWSGIGRGGAESAAAWVAKNGGTTLESTLASRGIQLPVWDVSNPSAIAAWRQASIDFAAAARGDVRVLQGDFLRSDAIWRDEFAALLRNQNVTSIRSINPSTGAEVLLWSR